MSPKDSFSSMSDIQKILGEDFWDVLTEALPYVGPRVDVCKSEKEMLIVAELPGIQSSKDIQIYLEGNQLVIEGKIVKDYSASKELIVKNERYAGPFKRKIAMPTECMFSQLKAVYKKGLLKINIPLSYETKSVRQEIPIFIYDDYASI